MTVNKLFLSLCVLLILLPLPSCEQTEQLHEPSLPGSSAQEGVPADTEVPGTQLFENVNVPPSEPETNETRLRFLVFFVV